MTRLLCQLFLSLSVATSAADKPNFVFILGDDINRDSVGCYGGVDAPTPNIDRIAKEGVQFMRAYTSVAMCAPFRQELYSGRTPWRTRAFMNHSNSVKGTSSIPLQLQKLGYEVGIIGKTHIGPKSIYSFTYLAGGSNEKMMASARKFIEEARQAGKPFCVFVCSSDAHSPFNTGDQSQFDAAKIKVPPYWVDTPGFRKELVPYLAEVANFDALAGMMDSYLAEQKLADKTLFMVCTEQGSQFPFAKWTCYDNGLHTGLVARWTGVTKAGHKCNELVWMPDIAATFVAAAGGTVEPGTFDGKSILPMLRGEQHVNHEYVFGAFTNKGIIGSKKRIFPIRTIRTKTHSLIWSPYTDGLTSNLTIDPARKKVTGEGGDGSEAGRIKKMPAEAAPVLSWVNEAPGNSRIPQLWKRPEYELFDLTKDPYELKNLVDNPEYSAVYKTMTAQLHSFLNAHGDTDPVKTEKEISSNRK